MVQPRLLELLGPSARIVRFAWLNTLPCLCIQAVLAWSKGVVRSLQSAKMPSQEELATLPPPPADTWRFR